MEKLGKLFGTEARVKIMRLFLFNPGSTYDLQTITDRAKVTPKEAKRELALLENSGLIRPQKFVNEASVAEVAKDAKGAGKNAGKDADGDDKAKGKNKSGKSAKAQKTNFLFLKKKVPGWTLEDRFTYLNQLQSLLINTILIKEDEIVRRVCQLGKVRLIVVAGVFIQQWDSRADILVVGDRLKESQLQAIVRKMEAEIGKELSYAMLETPDFQYRMSVCDKLVRDVFDYPHRVLLDKLGIKLGF